MKCEISEICGDWALDIDGFNGGKITIYFNSKQNALNVKKILEVDDSIPNTATVCDMQEVVRCKECKSGICVNNRYMCKRNAIYDNISKEFHGLCAVEEEHFCSYGKRKDEE